jgi:hypothetical protein
MCKKLLNLNIKKRGIGLEERSNLGVSLRVIFFNDPGTYTTK